MKNYDGPSFYKKDHPKVAPIQPKKKKASQEKYSLPKQVRTRKDIQDDAHRYMETPSVTKRRFRSTKVPTSLQQLDDLEKTRKNVALIEQIEARLHKEPSEYLLFEEYLAEELKPKPQAKPKPKSKPKTKATFVQEKVTPAFRKPNSGLHRSLSKIIADDQEALKNRKSHLDSLFSEDK